MTFRRRSAALPHLYSKLTSRGSKVNPAKRFLLNLTGLMFAFSPVDTLMPIIFMNVRNHPNNNLLVHKRCQN